MSFSLHGVGISRGIAIGKAHIIARDDLVVREYSIAENKLGEEIDRFESALEQARLELRAVKAQIPASAPSDVTAFIDTHLLMLDDAALADETKRHIEKKRCNAEWALKIQRDALVKVFDAMDDAYLKTRRDDVDHVVTRIQRILLNHAPAKHEVGDSALAGGILIADDLTPADTLLMQHQNVAAFVTEFGGPTSHTSILARSLGIAAVVGVHHARRFVREDELLIVDGDEGAVIGDPDDRTLKHYRRRQREHQAYYASFAKLRDTPAVTVDGKSVDLNANVELANDLVAAQKAGAQGIGLYRTEFLYMNRTDPPSEEEHFETYGTLLGEMSGLPVTIRTMDLGADKPLDADSQGRILAVNPALGLRGVRYSLKEPRLFWPQLRAIIRASALGPVQMMIPMLSTHGEARQVVGLVREMQAEFRRDGVAFDETMPIGGMVEVPSVAVFADSFAGQLDFLSIGTNDLIQYTLAIDRINDEVSYLHDPLDPAVLRLISWVIKAGKRAKIPVAMCGEMAGESRYTPLLLGLGLRNFSVHPGNLLEIKSVINATDTVDVSSLARRLLKTTKLDRYQALLDELLMTRA